MKVELSLEVFDDIFEDSSQMMGAGNSILAADVFCGIQAYSFTAIGFEHDQIPNPSL